jgi:hypothetical protein
MKHRRTLIYGASAVIMLATLAMVLRMNVGDILVTSASAKGAVLSAVELGPTERIVVDYAGSGCRDYHNWNFVLLGGAERRLAVIDAGGSYEPGQIHDAQPAAIGAISLSPRDCKGFDDLLRLYRQPDGSSGSTTTIKIRVSYFRGEERIGVEDFVDQGMIENWIWQRDQYGLVPADSGVTPEMLSFPELVRRATEANQSSEPTTTSGTSAAEQPLVPAAVVAHL